MKAYTRKRPDGWADKDRRMKRAARLRDEGMSLRQIAADLCVSHMTVSRDLERWDEAHRPAGDNVVSLSRKLSHRAVTSSPAQQGRGRDVTGGCDSSLTTGDVLGLTASEERIARTVAMLTVRGAS